MADLWQQLLFSLLLLTGGSCKLYDVEMLRFEHISGESQTLVDFSQLQLMGAEPYLNGSVQILEDMDDANYQMSVDFERDSMRIGEWRRMIYAVPRGGICRVLRQYVGIYGRSTLQQPENCNLPFDGKQCPVPKGSYFVKQLLMNADTWPDILPFGNMRANFRFFKEGKSIGGAQCDTQIMPKN